MTEIYKRYRLPLLVLLFRIGPAVLTLNPFMHNHGPFFKMKIKEFFTAVDSCVDCLDFPYISENEKFIADDLLGYRAIYRLKQLSTATHCKDENSMLG